MDASDLENLAREYSEQFEKYQTLIRGIRQLADNPDQLPRSLKFEESTGDSLRLSFVGRTFTIFHESDLPMSTLWSKIMITMDETTNGKTTLQGFLRIDRSGNVKPDTAMSSQYTVENPKEVLMMLLDLGVT